MNHLTDATFDPTIFAGSAPALVDFWAPWCQPCHAMAPVVDALAQETGDRLRVYKVNVDESPRLAERFHILSIPTFLIFKGGQVVDQFSGIMNAAAMRERVSRFFSA